MTARRLVLLLIFAGLVWGLVELGERLSWTESRTAVEATSRADPVESVAELFRQRRSGVMVEVSGEVLRLLPDDDEGSRHQRFILRLADDQTLLVSHNIDLARRVPLSGGDRLELRGQYEWNDRGGVVHWTHHDPQGGRPGGWIRHAGELYR